MVWNTILQSEMFESAAYCYKSGVKNLNLTKTNSIYLEENNRKIVTKSWRLRGLFPVYYSER